MRLLAIRAAVQMGFVVGIAMASATTSGADVDIEPYCEQKGSGDVCSIYGVSLINLLATPLAFHGKKVRTVAHMYVERGWSALKLNGLGTYESIWLAPGEGEYRNEEDVGHDVALLRKWRRVYNERLVLVEGTFDAHMKPGVTRGAITKVTRIEVLSKPTRR